MIESGDVEAFLHPLPVTVLWGVGAQTGEALERLGLKTVGDLARIPRRTLERALGDALGAHLYSLARGNDDRPVTPGELVKSVGSEETYPHDLDDTEVVLREILRLADRTAGRLRAKGMCGRTVTLKIRFSNFMTITRSRTLTEEVDATADLYGVTKEAYLKLDPVRPRIRLLGVSVSGLAPGPPARQLDLLSEPAGPRRREASKAIDSIRSRFGQDALDLASLLDRP
jgi:DNA polymerase-4